MSAADFTLHPLTQCSFPAPTAIIFSKARKTSPIVKPKLTVYESEPITLSTREKKTTENIHKVRINRKKRNVLETKIESRSENSNNQQTLPSRRAVKKGKWYEKIINMKV